MAHMTKQQSAGGQIRTSRDADARVALPLSYSSVGRPAMPPEPNGGVARSSPPEGAPTIVQSSAEGAANNGNAVVANGGGSQLFNAADMPPFSTDPESVAKLQYSRYVKFKSITGDECTALFKALGDQYTWNGKITGEQVIPLEDATFYNFYFFYNDLRDAANAQAGLHQYTQHFAVEHITFEEYDMVSTLCNRPFAGKFDGQVMFEVKFVGTKPDVINLDSVRIYVYRLAQSCGELRVFKDTSSAASPTWQFRAEFWKISDALTTLDKAGADNMHCFNNWTIVAKALYDIPVAAGNGAMSVSPTRHLNGAIGMQCSPTGRTAWSVDENGVQVPQQPAHQMPKYSFGSNSVGQIADAGPQRERFFSAPSPDVSAALNHVAGHPRSHSFGGPLPTQMTPYHGRHVHIPDSEAQNVDLNRIIQGLDTRTTIMLRNVPNKWTCDDLKVVLDSVIHGNYDFSYLRIDFAVNNNVGYAFVNLTEAKYIIPFFHHLVGKEWEPGKWPRKVCQISYATIQGIECLIDKFRNSAVMSEFHGFRPKLFWTYSSAANALMVGVERAFPECNNPSKKQRSLDNAGQIGLYAPRSGHRGGDRGRRSQYDRGTPAQIHEDAYYNRVSPGAAATAASNRYIAAAYDRLGGPNAFSPYNYAYTPASMPASYGYGGGYNPYNGYGGYAGPGAAYYPAPIGSGPAVNYQHAHAHAHVHGGGNGSGGVQGTDGTYVYHPMAVARSMRDEANAGGNTNSGGDNNNNNHNGGNSMGRGLPAM